MRNVLQSDPEDGGAVPASYSRELRALCKDLLNKTAEERLTCAQMLISPLLLPRVRKFVTDYRPKSVEDKVKRSYTKQLEYQVGRLLIYKQVGARGEWTAVRVFILCHKAVRVCAYA